MHDPYVAKAFEYLLGLAFLALFAGFWRYATGGADVSEARARVAVKPPARLPLLDMFRVPEGVLLHPGHAWVRADAPGIAAVGLDDFARQLVGPLKGVALPPVGATLEQGARGWGLRADSKTVEMIAPVSGRVVAVNEDLLANPATINDDPYGRGWLLKVEAPRLDTNVKQLLAGRAARDLMAASWDELTTIAAPQVGLTMHDGGVPVNGFARGIDPEHWDAVARRFLLT